MNVQAQIGWHMIIHFLLWYEDKRTCIDTHIDRDSGKNRFLFALSDPPSRSLNKHCPTHEAQLNEMQEETCVLLQIRSTQVFSENLPWNVKWQISGRALYLSCVAKGVLWVLSLHILRLVWNIFDQKISARFYFDKNMLVLIIRAPLWVLCS